MLDGERLLRHKPKRALGDARVERAVKVRKSVSSQSEGIWVGGKRKRASVEGESDWRVAAHCEARMRVVMRRGERAHAERILRGASGPFLFFGC